MGFTFLPVTYLWVHQRLPHPPSSLFPIMHSNLQHKVKLQPCLFSNPWFFISLSSACCSTCWALLVSVTQRAHCILPNGTHTPPTHTPWAPFTGRRGYDSRLPVRNNHWCSLEHRVHTSVRAATRLLLLSAKRLGESLTDLTLSVSRFL